MGGGSWLVVSLAVGTTRVSAVAVRVAFFGFRLLGVLFLDVLRLDVRRLDLSGPSLQLSDCRGVRGLAPRGGWGARKGRPHLWRGQARRRRSPRPIRFASCHLIRIRIDGYS